MLVTLEVTDPMVLLFISPLLLFLQFYSHACVSWVCLGCSCADSIKYSSSYLCFSSCVSHPPSFLSSFLYQICVSITSLFFCFVGNLFWTENETMLIHCHLGDKWFDASLKAKMDILSVLFCSVYFRSCLCVWMLLCFLFVVQCVL